MLASSRRAVYIETGGTVLALVSASAPAGPIHMRVRRHVPHAPGGRFRLDGQLPVSCPVAPADARRRPPTAPRGRGAWSLTETAKSGLAGHPAVNVAEWAVDAVTCLPLSAPSPGWAPG